MTTVDQYAVFGNPIAHSKSPRLQMAFAEQTQQTINYTAQCVEEKNFSVTANAFFSQGGKGLNITVPFKLDAWEYADELTARAQRAGAVNTLIKKEQKIIGDNTDGFGLLTDIRDILKWPIADTRVAILGAGGAVRGILEPLLSAGVREIVIANRTVEKAMQLAKDFSDLGKISGCEFSALTGHFDLIINGTSASLQGQLPPLPEYFFHEKSYCYDMMYGKEPTVFMKAALDNGVKNISDGLGMLVCQGAESFYQWRGVRPDPKPVITTIRAEL